MVCLSCLVKCYFGSVVSFAPYKSVVYYFYWVFCYAGVSIKKTAKVFHIKQYLSTAEPFSKWEWNRVWMTTKPFIFFPCFRCNCIIYLLKFWGLRSTVVYFDQRLGAAHPKFSLFFAINVKTDLQYKQRSVLMKSTPGVRHWNIWNVNKIQTWPTFLLFVRIRTRTRISIAE